MEARHGIRLTACDDHSLAIAGHPSFATAKDCNSCGSRASALWDSRVAVLGRHLLAHDHTTTGSRPSNMRHVRFWRHCVEATRIRVLVSRQPSSAVAPPPTGRRSGLALGQRRTGPSRGADLWERHRWRTGAKRARHTSRPAGKADSWGAYEVEPPFGSRDDGPDFGPVYRRP